MTSDAPHEAPGLISGRKILLWSAIILVVGTFAATWGTLRWVESALPEPEPLDWSHREAWAAMKPTAVLLEADPQMPSFVGKPRKSLDFTLPADKVKVVQTLASVADVAGPGDLRPLIAMAPDLFYGHYLRGLALQQAGERDESEAALIEAMALAPAAVVVQVHDDLDQPVSGLAVTVEIACARKAKGSPPDDSLRLVYPRVRTDSAGRLYLPVFDTPCMVRRVEGPAGYQFSGGQRGWFEFPGEIGLLPPVRAQRVAKP